MGNNMQPWCSLFEIQRDCKRQTESYFHKKTYLIFVCTLPRKHHFLTLGKVTETWIIFFENDPRLYDFVWLFALKGPIFCLWIGRKEDNYNLFAGYKIAMVLLGTMLFPWKLYRFTIIPFVSFHGKQRFQDIIWFPRNWATPKKLEPYPIILVDYRAPNNQVFFPGSTEDIAKNNCCSFCQALSESLGVMLLGIWF